MREGRKRGLAKMFGDLGANVEARLPDPLAEQTYRNAKLNWQELHGAPARAWLAFHRKLLTLRRQEIAPRLKGLQKTKAQYALIGTAGLLVSWRLADGAELTLLANLGDAPLAGLAPPAGRLLYSTHEEITAALGRGLFPNLAVAWWIAPNRSHG